MFTFMVTTTTLAGCCGLGHQRGMTKNRSERLISLGFCGAR
jgi:hypothetical protein